MTTPITEWAVNQVLHAMDVEMSQTFPKKHFTIRN